MPPDQIPGPGKYWRTHTSRQILAREGHGLVGMVTVSYGRFWYLKAVALYVALALLLMATRWRAFRRLIREFAQARWTMAGVTVTPAHVHLLVFATIGLDLVFTLPARLLADF